MQQGTASCFGLVSTDFKRYNGRHSPHWTPKSVAVRIAHKSRAAWSHWVKKAAVRRAAGSDDQVEVNETQHVLPHVLP